MYHAVACAMLKHLGTKFSYCSHFSFDITFRFGNYRCGLFVQKYFRWSGGLVLHAMLDYTGV